MSETEKMELQNRCSKDEINFIETIEKFVKSHNVGEIKISTSTSGVITFEKKILGSTKYGKLYTIYPKEQKIKPSGFKNWDE